MKLIGIILIIASIVAGVYVGFWLMFVGGIVDIINAIKAPVTEASAVGWGALKIALAGAAGTITFWIGMIISAVFLAE